MPKRGVAYSFSRGLYDATLPGRFCINPTIAAGDFTISKDNGVFVALTNVPIVSPGGSPLVRFDLTAEEMTADRVTILGVDQAGAQWTEFMEHLEPDLVMLADIPTALQIADTVLTRDWTLIGSLPPTYCMWNALRFLRNAWALVSGSPPVLHVKREDGNADAWTRTVDTSAAALPVTGMR
jgi:hypothetical protein